MFNFKIRNGKELDINGHDDLRYVFRRFYAQSPGIINVYQQFRFYADEHEQDPSYQENFDNMAEMKRRIFAENNIEVKEPIIEECPNWMYDNPSTEVLTFDKMKALYEHTYNKTWVYTRNGD